jgi:hypothetical protein
VLRRERTTVTRKAATEGQAKRSEERMTTPRASNLKAWAALVVGAVIAAIAAAIVGVALGAAAAQAATPTRATIEATSSR